MTPTSSAITSSLPEFRKDLGEIDLRVREGVQVVSKAKPEHSLKLHQADWHIRGLTYHCRNLVESYAEVAEGVGARAASGANVIVMHAPAVQRMWFEFYGLVSLARITLDNLRNLLAPVFLTDFGQLPKSISDFLDGGSNCPVYLQLMDQPTVEYMSDIRDCIVHFRTFATNDNAFITETDCEQQEPAPHAVISDWVRPMARGAFRRIDEGRVAVNFYLPDMIFVRQGNSKKLAEFTYERKINIISQSMEFVRLASVSTYRSFGLLLDPGKPTFTYKKPKRLDG